MSWHIVKMSRGEESGDLEFGCEGVFSGEGKHLNHQMATYYESWTMTHIRLSLWYKTIISKTIMNLFFSYLQPFKRGTG